MLRVRSLPTSGATGKQTFGRGHPPFQALPLRALNVASWHCWDCGKDMRFWPVLPLDLAPGVPKPRTLAFIILHQRYPEGPARHLDASRQKLPPHCLAAIFDSQLPSSKLSGKMPPKLPLPHTRGHFFLFQNCPRGEGNCAAIERQKLSRGNFCLAASRCLSGPSGYPQYCLGFSKRTF